MSSQDSRESSLGITVGRKFGSHDWDQMPVEEWAAHTDVPGMYIDERKHLYEEFLPAAMKGVKVVIDVGCGLGEDTFYIANTYSDVRVIGLDFNRDFLKHCEKVMAKDHPHLQKRLSFEWADLRLTSTVDKLRAMANGQKALYYMGGNTIGIVPEGLEATIGAALSDDDRFFVVAHYAPFLNKMYHEYYAKTVGEMDPNLTDFNKGLYVSKGDYRSQWYTPETLTERMMTYGQLAEESCVCGKTAGVYGIYKKPATKDALGMTAGRKFGSHDWDQMPVEEWAAHTDVPGMYIDERKHLYDEFLPAAMKGVKVVIDVGCGLGEDTFYIANTYPDVTVIGLDFNKDFLSHCDKVLAKDHPNLKKRLSFQWADLRLTTTANKLRAMANGQKALYYMGGNTIGIVPEGLEGTIGEAMQPDDRFFVVAHYAPFLRKMYHEYYAKTVGEMDRSLTDFDKGLYVSKGDYRSQWYWPETLTQRIMTYGHLVEESCVCGATAGVYGIYKKPESRDALGLTAGRKFGSHDWDQMPVEEWAAHTDVPGMYIDERKHLYEEFLPAAMKGVKVVIDVGCGLGEDTFYIAKAFPEARVIGFDFNRDFLAHCRKVLAKDYEHMRQRVSFEWADLRLKVTADKLRAMANGEKALYYMGGNTIGIVPEGLEATIGDAMRQDDRFFVVAHYAPFLRRMYHEYYAKTVGELNRELSDFDKGLYVSKGDYRSQWYTPETLSQRITTYANLVEDSCKCGATAGVYGIYKRPLTSKL